MVNDVKPQAKPRKRSKSVASKKREVLAAPADDFRLDNDDPDDKARSESARVRILKAGLLYDEERYEYREDFVPADKKNFMEIHTTSEMIQHLRENKDVQLEARVLGTTKHGQRAMVKMNREGFLESVKQRDSKKLREAYDNFMYDNDYSDGGNLGGPIGKDFTPLLGGPFNKQLYYRDYLRMIAACFFAFHHDPAARAVVNIMNDFTIGRGYKVKATGKDADKAQLLWDMFSLANHLPVQMDYCARETSIYGENMWWWLPNNQTRISFNPGQGETIPKGLIPRVRLIDPSNIAEVITVPEDPIMGILYYVWLAPTQYQMWTADKQPSSKFIYTQIPADQVMHTKINCVSNEKRGRSDYFPALGYMKRLRDSVNYSLVGLQKAAAWCVDTTIDGNAQDIDDYITGQKALGAIAPAGSEFVHTKAITREYLSNSAAGKSSEAPTFMWALSMIAMSTGIPISYLGTHLSGGQTRASALVATEPVAKRFESRRDVYRITLHSMFENLMRRFKYNADCYVIFPELITQDRTAKFRDLRAGQDANWFSHQRVAESAAKEMDFKDYDYQQEQMKIKDQDQSGITGGGTNPLTAEPKAPQNEGGLDSTKKEEIKDQLGNL